MTDTYESPLMGRMNGGRNLTVEFLRTWVPAYQEGKKAEDQLRQDTDLPADERQRLEALARTGNQAAELLVTESLHLVRRLAVEELKRRAGWKSRVTLSELVQEGMIGLLRGLLVYDVDKATHAPTHYLGQRITVEMRRNVESLDHDFAVPYDTAERMRRVRAIRNRVEKETGNTATIDDIVEGSAAPAPRSGVILGRKNGPTRSRTPVLTPANVEEEVDSRRRVGTVDRVQEHLTTNSDDDRDRSDDVDAVSVTATPIDNGEDTAMAQWRHQFMQTVIDDSITLLRLPTLQQQIIRMHYGLPPELREHSFAMAAAKTGVSKEFAEEIVVAFQGEMTRPGGAFHRACGKHDADVLADAGLGWVLATLGTPPPPNTTPPATPPALTAAPPVKQVHRAAIVPRASGIHAEFVCPMHRRSFWGAYRYMAHVPNTRECPACGHPSPRTQLVEQP